MSELGDVVGGTSSGAEASAQAVTFAQAGALPKSSIISMSEVVASMFLLVALTVVIVAKSFVTCRVQQGLGSLWYRVIGPHSYILMFEGKVIFFSGVCVVRFGDDWTVRLFCADFAGESRRRS
jgi:hypothetical protein